MEKLLSELLSFPPHPPPAKPLTESEYDGQIRELVRKLNTTASNKLVQPVNGSESLLDVLDPALNSPSYLYALVAHISIARKDGSLAPGQPIWSKIERFVGSFDPVQIRYVGHVWKQLVDELLSVARRGDQLDASLALELVQVAMLRLDPEASTFTSTHLALIKLCLRRRTFVNCSRILDCSIFHFPSDPEYNKFIPLPCAEHTTSSTFITTASGFSDKLTYRDHMQYLLFGAMIYIGQRLWSRASLFLELVIASPTLGNTASMIQVEAYKKWLLVNLLLHGRSSNLPRNVSPQTGKLLNNLSKPYMALADAFKEESSYKLKGEFEAGFNVRIWQVDRNLGLTKLVVAAHRRAQVLRYSKVYSSIPLRTLAELMSEAEPSEQPTSPAVFEDDVKALVSSGSITAAIVAGKSGAPTIQFLDSSGKAPLSDAQQQVELRRSIVAVARLDAHVKDAQKRLELTREYMEATRKRRKPNKETMESIAAGQGVGDIAMQGDIDEDMLADF